MLYEKYLSEFDFDTTPAEVPTAGQVRYVSLKSGTAIARVGDRDVRLDKAGYRRKVQLQDGSWRLCVTNFKLEFLKKNADVLVEQTEEGQTMPQAMVWSLPEMDMPYSSSYVVIYLDNDKESVAFIGSAHQCYQFAVEIECSPEPRHYKIEKLELGEVTGVGHQIQLISAKEMAAAMGVSLPTVYSRLRSGEIPATKFDNGRYEVQLDQFYSYLRVSNSNK